jgi:hypothetical protein
MKKTAKKPQQKESPERISAAEALKRMKGFAKRKEDFVAAVKTSKN